MEIVRLVGGDFGKVVIRNTAASHVGLDRAYGVPARSIGFHDHETVRPRHDGFDNPPAFVPKLKIATILQPPVGRDVIEQVQSSITLAHHIMAVVDMRVQKITGEHHRQSTRIKLWVGLELRHARAGCHKIHNSRILKCICDVGQDRGISAEISRSSLSLPKGFPTEEARRIPGKCLIYFFAQGLGQKIIHHKMTRGCPNRTRPLFPNAVALGAEPFKKELDQGFGFGHRFLPSARES